MKKYLYIYLLLTIFSCGEKKQNIQIRKKIGNVKTKNVYNKRDLIFDVFKNVQNAYSIWISNKKDFDKTLIFFIKRNKLYFKELSSEREAIYINKKIGAKIYVREWVFSNSSNAKKIEKIINKPTYSDISNNIGLVVDTLKEPYFTYRIENKLYVFYVISVSKVHYINHFKNIVDKITSQE